MKIIHHHQHHLLTGLLPPVDDKGDIVIDPLRSFNETTSGQHLRALGILLSTCERTITLKIETLADQLLPIGLHFTEDSTTLET